MTQREAISRVTSAEPVRGPEPRQVTPPVDIYENEQELLLVADLPGVPPDALRVSLEMPELRLEARSVPAGGDAPVSFARTFRVDDRIDPDGVSAALTQGVLRVRLKKSAALRQRRIEVTSA